jgi:hypothetical protein
MTGPPRIRKLHDVGNQFIGPLIDSSVDDESGIYTIGDRTEGGGYSLGNIISIARSMFTGCKIEL